MAQYLLKRLGMTFAVVLLVTLFLASMVHLIPGDPIELLLGPRATDEMIANAQEEMGLNEPIWAQVGQFMWNAAQGDLGNDLANNRPVSMLVGNAAVHTMTLAFFSLFLSVALGIPFGVLAATKPDSLLDRFTSVVSVSFITMPSYVTGLFLLLIFPIGLEVLPATGTGDLSQPLDYLRHLILPAGALAITWVGYFARLVRSSMLEVVGSNYIRVARAYGLRERAVHYRFALKNAVIPTIAILGVALGNLLGGSVFVELIFARPGLGNLAVQAVEGRNFPVLRGSILVIALLFVVANLAADLSYRFIDPRIRVEEQQS
ncbi:MAG: ABC transporter permease [Nitriliruptoraceae bacterium]